VKPKRKQALLRSNLSAIGFMDVLYFGKDFIPSLFLKIQISHMAKKT
jgi:hypothetical protein